MAKCQNCGKEGKVLIKADKHPERYLGWCKYCISKDEYELRQQAGNAIGGFVKNIFGR